MNTTSPRSSLAKLGLFPKPKPFKVMVLGQSGVGKSALVVRFITRRYIGEYDPTLEKVYTFNTVIDSEMVYFEILDSAGDPQESEYLSLEANIRWAEAFILMYSVTDKCSFDECHRLKFLINYNKRRRRLTTNSSKEGCGADVPVVLVGNKADLAGDRMVSAEEGQRRSKEIGCVCFHEISVRESIDQVWGAFRDARRFWRLTNKSPRLRRAAHADGELHPAALTCILTAHTPPDHDLPANMPLGCSWMEVDLPEEGSDYTESGLESRSSSTSSCSRDGVTCDSTATPFRSRASTDSHLVPRPYRNRHPPSTSAQLTLHGARRMSISMRGNNTGSY